MMTISSRAAAAAFASLLFVSSAFAQSTTAPAASEPAAKMARSSESLDCSKQADDKGLHGKERKKFRSACIKEARAKK